MKFTVSRADIARALGAVARVIERRNTIPILGNVLLAASGDGVDITGTDLDIQVAARTSAEVASGGSTTVDAARLNDIVKKSGADPVSFAATETGLVVKSGRSRFTLPVMSPDDFPNLAAGSVSAAFNVDLASLFAPVQFAMSTEETRYYLNGVYLHKDGDNLVAVATDGHRLARATAAACAPDFAPVIVPRKLVGILPKGDVSVCLSANMIQLVAQDLVITSKLIDGTFPDYKRVIPANNHNMLTVNRQVFRDAVSRVAAVDGSSSRGVRLNVTTDGVSLAMASANGGSANDEIDAELNGENVEIGFNSKYLAEILGIPGGENIAVALSDGGTPALFFVPENDAWLGLVMPVRV